MRLGGKLRFVAIALAAGLLYGFMAWGSYGIPAARVPNAGVSAWGLVLSALLWTYSWFPGFLAGLLAGRGAVPLAVVTVVIGAVAKSVFHSLFSPMVVIDDWDPAIVNLVQGLLAIVAAAVAAFAGQCMSRRRGWVTAKD